jgi:hypothetical protein
MLTLKLEQFKGCKSIHRHFGAKAVSNLAYDEGSTPLFDLADLPGSYGFLDPTSGNIDLHWKLFR